MLLPRREGPRGGGNNLGARPALVRTPTVERNLQAAALALCQQQPLLLCGPPGETTGREGHPTFHGGVPSAAPVLFESTSMSPLGLPVWQRCWRTWRPTPSDKCRKPTWTPLTPAFFPIYRLRQERNTQRAGGGDGQRRNGAHHHRRPDGRQELAGRLRVHRHPRRVRLAAGPPDPGAVPHKVPTVRKIHPRCHVCNATPGDFFDNRGS